MKIVLIRHGENDTFICHERNYIGLGLELSPLTELGCKQAEQAALDARLIGAQLIVSSPYTRCMQTAAIISRITNTPLTVEMDLHEWVADISFSEKPTERKKLIEDFTAHKGKWPEGETRRWETLDMVSERVIHALNKYQNYEKIIAVIHGIVIQRLGAYAKVPNCFIDEIEFDENFKSPPTLGWWI
jgi:broad specificity phosphatase PhoE